MLKLASISPNSIVVNVVASSTGTESLSFWQKGSMITDLLLKAFNTLEGSQ